MLKSSPASSLISSSSLARLLGEAAGEAGERRPLDPDAGPLHQRQNRRDRPLQGLVDGVDVFCDQPWLEHEPEPQADIGLLAGKFGGARDRHAVESDGGAAGAHDLLVGEAGVGEQRAGKLLWQMPGAARVERIGHEAGIVEAGQLDAVAGEHHHVEFGILHDLEHGRIFEQRFQQIERLAHLDARALFAAEIELIGCTVGERNVGRLSGAKGKCHADKLPLHRIGRSDLGAKGDMALVARFVEQRGKPLRMDYRLVFAAVEGKGGKLGRTLFGKMQRRTFLRRVDRLGPLGDEASARCAPERVVVVVLLLPLCCRRRCRTGGSLDAQTVGDAAEQCAEFEPAQEAQQRLCLWLADQSLGKRHIKRHVCIEDHQRARQPRLVGESDRDSLAASAG